MKFFGTIIFTIITFSIFAQTTITLQPGADGKDCEVWSLSQNTNYISDLLRGNAWSWGLDNGIERGLIQFDLSSVPANATILTAYLSLFAPDSPSTEFESGDNGGLIDRITSTWDESTVTWSNQPSTTTQNEVTLASSVSNYQDYPNINVTALVQDMIDNPSSSFGFELRLQNELQFRRLSFCSGDYPNSANHPKLVVTYSESNVVDSCVTFQPGENEGNDAEVWSLQPSTFFASDLLRANAWTWSSQPGIQRGLFQFDFSALPINAIITSAYLSLFAPDSPSTEFESPSSGPNDAWLQRITSDWDESGVTWDNQPTTTATNEVTLPESVSSYQDYPNIDVKSLVQDMINDPLNSFGFMIKLKTETPKRRLSFCASNYANQAKHPKLEVCYLLNTEVPGVTPENYFSVFPNPATDHLVLNSATTNSSEHITIRIIDLSGKVVMEREVTGSRLNEYFDISKLPSATYFVFVSSLHSQHHMMVIKQ